MAEPIGLDEIMKAANALQSVGANAARIITEGTVESLKIQKEREENLAKSVPDQVLVETQKSAARLNSIQNSRKAASSFAINQDEANEIVTMMGERYVKNAKRASDIAEEIAKRQSVKPWEDPISWLGNQLVIPFQQEELKATSEAAGIAQKSITAANEAVQAQAQTENTIEQSITTESQMAQQRLIYAAAQEKLAQLQQQGIALNTANVKAVYEMTSSQMDTYIKINQVFNSQEYLNIARENQRISSARWANELNDKKEQEAERENIARVVNKGRAALNLPPLPSRHIMAQFKIGGEVSKVNQQAYITGSAIESSGAPFIGESPAKAAEIIVMSNAPLTTEQQVVKKFLTGTVSEAAGTIPPQIDTKNTKAVADYVNKQVTDLAYSQQKNIKTGDATNIYAATSLKAISSWKAMVGSTYYNTVLKPLLDAGYDKVDPEDLVSKTAMSIMLGQIDYEAGTVGLAALFRGAVAVNNETKRYNMVGLPPQSSYNIKIAAPFLQKSHTFDLTNPAQVSTLVSRYMAMQTQPFPPSK